MSYSFNLDTLLIKVSIPTLFPKGNKWVVSAGQELLHRVMDSLVNLPPLWTQRHRAIDGTGNRNSVPSFMSSEMFPGCFHYY